MTDRSRAETGEFDDRIPLDRVRDVFAALEDSAEPLDAGQIADRADMARRTAHNKLEDLVDADELRTRKVGARGRVWWQPHYDTEPEPRERREAACEPPAVDDDHSATDDAADDESASEAAEPDREALAADLRATLPGSGELLEQRVDAILEMYDRIREADGDAVTTSELQALVDGDGLGYASDDSFWNNAVKKNAAQDRPNSLTSLPGVAELGNGRYCYQRDEADE